jgi:hypothetical protein
VKQNQRISATKVTAELKDDLDVNVCTGTVRNSLRSRRYHGRVARRKYFVSEANRKKRLEFAKKYINTPMEYWKRVIFTDESKFNIFGSDGHCIVWTKNNTGHKKRKLASYDETRRRFSASLGVFECDRRWIFALHRWNHEPPCLH